MDSAFLNSPRPIDPASPLEYGRQDQSAPPPWNRFTLFLFRFVFLYMLLYNLQPSLEDAAILPAIVEPKVYAWKKIDPPVEGLWSNRPAKWVESQMHAAIPWVWSLVPDSLKPGELAKQITVFPFGSGDTTYNYVEIALYTLVALLLTTLWTLFSRNRPSHPRLHGLLRIDLRYVLGIAMIGYGLAKVVPTQMPAPSPFKLTEPYGDASPMGLLWTFIGASKAYSVFAGAGELIAGLLLLWRRTATLGALVAAIVLANVVALNFCYDVPVKLYSSHLLLMAIILLAPRLRRLADALLSDRALPPAPTRPLFTPNWARYTWGAIKAILVMAYVAMQTQQSIENYYTNGDGAALPPLYGLYTVEQQAIDGALQPPLTTNADRWRDIIFDRVYKWRGDIGYLRARAMTDAAIWYQYKINPQNQTITLISLPGESRQSATRPSAPASQSTSELSYREPDAGHLILSGSLHGHKMEITLLKRPLDKFFLVSRGFHWVNEYPLNR